MSFKLEQPYTDKQRADFIVEYNHRLGLKIEASDGDLYALEPDEILQEGNVIKNPDYEVELAQTREELFKSKFFQTSLGWIRRKVSMKDGSTKDFLSDLLMQIKIGIDAGQEIPIVTYNTPLFTQELTEEYLVSLQANKAATPEFIQECLAQLVNDFYGG